MYIFTEIIATQPFEKNFTTASAMPLEIDIYIYIYIYIVHQKHHLSRSFLQKKAYKTTKIFPVFLWFYIYIYIYINLTQMKTNSNFFV